MLECFNSLGPSYVECPTNGNCNTLDLVFSDIMEAKVDIADDPLIEVDMFHHSLNLNLDLWCNWKRETGLSFDYKKADYEAIIAEISKIN